MIAGRSAASFLLASAVLALLLILADGMGGWRCAVLIVLAFLLGYCEGRR